MMTCTYKGVAFNGFVKWSVGGRESSQGEKTYQHMPWASPSWSPALCAEPLYSPPQAAQPPIPVCRSQCTQTVSRCAARKCSSAVSAARESEGDACTSGRKENLLVYVRRHGWGCILAHIVFFRDESIITVQRKDKHGQAMAGGEGMGHLAPINSTTREYSVTGSARSRSAITISICPL